MFSTRRPGNSSRTRSTAVPTPKMVFAITVKTATCAVTLKAGSAEGVVSDSTTGAMPSWKVVQQMRPTGRTSRKSRYTRATVRSPYLATTGPPALEQVEGDEHDQRDHEEHGGDGGRPRHVVALDLAED